MTIEPLYTTLPAKEKTDVTKSWVLMVYGIGVPDQYILQSGGWSSDNIMKSVYRNVIDAEAVKQNKKIINNTLFGNLIPLTK